MPDSATQTDQTNHSKKRKIKSFVSDAFKFHEKSAADEVKTISPLAHSRDHTRGRKPRNVKYAIARERELEKTNKFFNTKIFSGVAVKDLPGIAGLVEKGVVNLQEGQITFGGAVAEGGFRASEYFATKYAVKKIVTMLGKRMIPGVGVALTAVEAYLFIEKPLKELTSELLKKYEPQLKQPIIEFIDNNADKIKEFFAGNTGQIKLAQHQNTTGCHWTLGSTKTAMSSPIVIPDPVLQFFVDRAMTQLNNGQHYFPNFATPAISAADLNIDHNPSIQYAPLPTWVDRPFNNTTQTPFQSKTPAVILEDVLRKVTQDSAQTSQRIASRELADKIIHQQQFTRFEEGVRSINNKKATSVLLPD